MAHTEIWQHSFGCRGCLRITRNNLTHEVEPVPSGIAGADTVTQEFRNASGGNIDRATTLNFSFDGVGYQGHPGDTLASALLANGVGLVGRSFKYHRPRGIFSAGPEEPGALVQLGRGACAEPNTRATQVELAENLEAYSQNCWPSLQWDLLAINNLLSVFLPAGFYYKTFMAPRRLWPWYEGLIRRAAGLGTAPTGADPDSYLGCYAHCDVLIAGAGPSGLMAARTAARTGARVMIADENPVPGGWLRRERLDSGYPASHRLDTGAMARVGGHAECHSSYANHGLWLLRPQHDCLTGALRTQRPWSHAGCAQAALVAGAGKTRCAGYRCD